MQEGQDWCLHCGTGAPGSLGGGPGWRTGAAILGATAALVAGASVAAYAALEKTKPKHVAVLVSKTPVTSTPTPGAPGSTTPGAVTPTPGVPTTVKAAPPKIPTQTPIPESSGGSGSEANELFPPETTETGKSKKATKTGSKSTKGTSGTGTGTGEGTEGAEGSEGSSNTKTDTGAETPSPILLDTNAASTYNPYTYPATLFGDPSLAIDGEAKTVWTAQVQATSAPKMAEGLLLDLKTPQKLGSVTVKTPTKGVTVEVYGANGSTLPTSITDPAWARLVGLKVIEKKSTAFKLKTKGKSFRYIVLWLAKGPPSSTATSPGTVSIGEFELFP